MWYQIGGRRPDQPAGDLTAASERAAELGDLDGNWVSFLGTDAIISFAGTHPVN